MRGRDPLTVFAIVVAVALLAVIVGALLRMPEPTRERVVIVRVTEVTTAQHGPIRSYRE